MTTTTIDASAITPELQEAADFLYENSTVKANGVREVPKAAFVKAMEKHGVTDEEMKKVQKAIDAETSAAGLVALRDTETRISEASKEDLKNEEFRKKLGGTVRLPTYGGSTEVEMKAEVTRPIPFKQGEDGKPEIKTSYGVTRATIVTKRRIDPAVHSESDARIRKALGVK